MAVSDTPWQPVEGNYTPQQWARACLIDTGDGPTDSKARYRLPVMEPGGVVNRNGAHAAAARIREVEGVSTELKAAAARKLVTIYRKDLAEDPPITLLNMAGDEGDRSAPEIERIFGTSLTGGKDLPVSLRSAQSGGRSIGGYASVFNSQSENLGGFREIVTPAFFNRSRGNGWPGVVCRYNHQDNYLLGATRSRTLRLEVDDHGLNYEVDLPECRNDVLEMVSRGDIANSSFAFCTQEDEWTTTDGGFPIRMLMSGKLMDVAPVTSPAYQDATVGLRSLARHVGAPIEDVVALSEKEELRSFFVRTDNRGKTEPKKQTKSGRAALMEILAERPEDPIGK